MTTPDLFGPWPASAQEREARVLAVFGPQGPLRLVQMRAVRHRCPGCTEPAGDQCSRGAVGGRRRARKLVHPSRVGVTHPCPTHRAPRGTPCPGEHQLPGVCAAREADACADLLVLAAGVVAESERREERDRDAAVMRRQYLAARLTGVERRG